MQKLFLFLPLTALLLAACGGGSTSAPSASTLTTVNGSVQGYSGGASTIKLLSNEDPSLTESATNPALASAPISASGAFALTLPSLAALTPYLSATSSSDDGVSNDGTCSGSVSNSDSTSQAYEFSALVANGQVYDTTTVTSTSSTSASLSAKSWIYVTKPTTLSGTVNCSSMSGGSTYNFTFSINTPFVQGWNVINLSETLTVSNGGSTRTATLNAVTGSDGPTTWTAATASTQSVQAAGLKAQLVHAQTLKASSLIRRAFSSHLKF